MAYLAELGYRRRGSVNSTALRHGDLSSGAFSELTDFGMSYVLNILAMLIIAILSFAEHRMPVESRKCAVRVLTTHLASDVGMLALSMSFPCVLSIDQFKLTIARPHVLNQVHVRKARARRHDLGTRHGVRI